MFKRPHCTTGQSTLPKVDGPSKQRTPIPAGGGGAAPCGIRTTVGVHTTQAPALQLLSSAQTFEHEPQVAPELRFASQPLSGLPSQSEKPGRHGPVPQVPPVHVAAIVFGRTGQAIPQAPQLLGLPRFTSQPFADAPSQFANPVLHANPQTPPVQVWLAFARAGQTIPQPPQLVG